MNQKKLYLWLLVMIIVLGIALRIYHLSVPFAGFHAVKEAQFADMALHFQERGNYLIPETHFEGINTNVFFPGWLIMWSWNIFGNYEWAARLPFLIMGVISILLLYLIGKELYDEKVGIFASFFLAISPMVAYFSRNAQGESPLIFFSLLSIYLFIRFYFTYNKKYLFLSSIALLFAVMSKYLALFLFLPIGWYLFKNRKESGLKIKDYLLYFVIPILPTFTFMHYVKIAARSAPFHSNYDFITVGFTNLNALFDIHTHIYRLVHFVGGVNPIVFLLAVFGFYIIFKDFNNKLVTKAVGLSNGNSDIFVLLWLLGYFLAYFTFLNIATPGNNYYLLSFIPPMCLIAARGMGKIKCSKILVGLLILAIFFSLATLFIIYSVNYPYKEAGKQMENLLTKDELFFRNGDPTVCYYANHQCYLYDGSGYDLEKEHYEFLSISRASFLRDVVTNPHKAIYIAENFRLLSNITGDKILISGNTFRANSEVEYELIYEKIKKE